MIEIVIPDRWESSSANQVWTERRNEIMHRDPDFKNLPFSEGGIRFEKQEAGTVSVAFEIEKRRVLDKYHTDYMPFTETPDGPELTEKTCITYMFSCDEILVKASAYYSFSLGDNGRPHAGVGMDLQPQADDWESTFTKDRIKQIQRIALFWLNVIMRMQWYTAKSANRQIVKKIADENEGVKKMESDARKNHRPYKYRSRPVILNGKVNVSVRTDPGREHESRTFTRHTETWMVRGHWRHYKSGKVIFIKSFTKGTGKTSQKEDKKYKIVGG